MAITGIEWLDTSLQMPLVSIPVRTAVIALPGARVMISPGSRLTPEALRTEGVLLRK